MDYQTSNKAICFNGFGWECNYSGDRILRFIHEKERVTKMIKNGAMFSYICARWDVTEEEKDTISRLLEERKTDLLVGVENPYTNSKAYYDAIGHFGADCLTFLCLFDDFISDSVARIVNYDDIPENLGKKQVYVIDAGEKTINIIETLIQREDKNIYIDHRSCQSSDSEMGNWWMFRSQNVSFDISVVLTLYKKPEALRSQINAIKSQSIGVKELLLLQDGIDKDYSIELKDEILGEFDNVRICKENRGVWERFSFAEEKAKSTYVCVFDDDTIPGSRWLENCHVHFQFEEGIYGTNGILLTESFLEYPYGGCVDVGWHLPNKRKVQVDFVGHSWFMKKKYLQYMFESSEILEEYKYVGEDMCLSVNAWRHGVPTFVPPHPIVHGELWGSTPAMGEVFGLSSVAVSKNTKRLSEMKEVIATVYSQGWKPLIKSHYVEVMKDLKEVTGNSLESQVIEEMDAFFDGGNVLIYGAGKYAGIIADFADKRGWQYDGFVVTIPQGVSVYKNKKIYLIDELERWKEYKIILGLSTQYHEDVSDILSRQENICVFPASGIPFSYDKFIEGLRDE